MSIIHSFSSSAVQELITMIPIIGFSSFFSTSGKHLTGNTRSHLSSVQFHFLTLTATGGGGAAGRVFAGLARTTTQVVCPPHRSQLCHMQNQSLHDQLIFISVGIRYIATISQFPSKIFKSRNNPITLRELSLKFKAIIPE